MARDYIDIGPTSCEEECAQVGSPNYAQRARSECNRFIDLIRRTVGPEPEGAHLAIKSNPYDFGTYYEVVVYYDTDDEEAYRYALKCESEGPTTWDDPRTTPAVQEDRVCDSCREAATEESGFTDNATLTLIMTEMGADLPDHLCDEVEDPNLGFKCLCACRRHR